MGGGASAGGLTPDHVFEAVSMLRSGAASMNHTSLLPLIGAAGLEMNSFLLCDPELDFVPSLLTAFKSDTGFLRTSALLILQNLSNFERNRLYLCSDDLGLVVCLLNLIQSCPDQSIVAGACRILQNVVAPTAKGISECCAICYEIDNYFPILMTKLRESKSSDVIKAILGILRCFAKHSYVSVLCGRFRLIPLLTQMLTTEHLQPAVMLLRIISIHADDRVAEELLEAALPAVGLLVLAEAGTDTSQWLTAKGVAEWLVFLMYSARFPAIATALKENKGIEVFKPLSVLAPCEGSVALKASILLAFLCGRDEAERGHSGVNDTIMDTLIDALNASLSGEVFGLDAAGVFRIPLLLSAFNTMIISDSNKRAFCNNSRVLPLLKRVLQCAIESNPDVDAIYGGGSDDPDYITLALNTVFSMSFIDEDVINDDLKYFSRESGILELVLQLNQRSILTEEAKHTARLLIGRLSFSSSDKSGDGPDDSEYVPLVSPRGGDPSRLRSGSKGSPFGKQNSSSTATTTSAERPHSRSSSPTNTAAVNTSGGGATSSASAATSSYGPRVTAGENPFPARDVVNTSPSPQNKSGSHIMLSYCYTEKRSAIKLQSELKKLGYDVWRDETGSSLVARMDGAYDDDMLAKAVESASHVVVCVSRSYKESQFCRMEANYAQQLCRNDRLQMHWVMLESDYTPISKGTSCNGWLGLMIGDDPWYPGFHDAAICASALKLTSIFGKAGYIESASDTVSGGRGSREDGLNVVAAYDLLMSSDEDDPSTASPAVKALLKRFGVKCAEDLEYLERDNLVELSNELKIVSRKKFLLAMKAVDTRK